jgi:bacteriophage HK97-gp10 putative tail-component
MKIGMKVYGCEELAGLMKQLAGRVPKQGRKIMDRGADKIVQEAQLNAPVDEHNLEDAIHKEKGYEDRGRLRVNLVVGGVVRGVDVDQYAMLIHENYESMNPGPGTLAKRAANPGRYVGGKFLERAVDEQMPKIQKQMADAIMRELAVLK